MHVLRAGRELDARVDILGVLTKHGHVHEFRLQHRRLHAREIPDRTNAGVQVHGLSNRDIQGAHAATRRGRKWALDRHNVFLQRMQCLVRQVLLAVVKVGSGLPGQDLHPPNLAIFAVGFGNSGIDNIEHHRRYIDANAIAFNERDDWLIRDNEGVIRIDRDRLTIGGHVNMVVAHTFSSLGVWVASRPGRRALYR